LKQLDCGEARALGTEVGFRPDGDGWEWDVGCLHVSITPSSDVDASHVPSLLSQLQRIDWIYQIFHKHMDEKSAKLQPLHSWSIDRLIRKAMTGNFHPQKPHPTSVT